MKEKFDINKWFYLTENQKKKAEKWRIKKTKKFTIEETAKRSFSYEFVITGIGIIIKIKCNDGTELDLTNYDTW